MNLFTHQLYGELKERIDFFEHDFIYQQLDKLEKSTKDLTHYERKRLAQLRLKYNPLN